LEKFLDLGCVVQLVNRERESIRNESNADTVQVHSQISLKQGFHSIPWVCTLMQLGAYGECCMLPQWGPRQSVERTTVFLCILSS